MTSRPADPNYENVLRETQRRVALPATPTDIVAYHRGMRAIDHRIDELTRVEGVLSRALRKVKARKTVLAEERSSLGAASDRDVVERLVKCEVVHDVRQGGVIFVRVKDTDEVVAERPVSAEERRVLAAVTPEETESLRLTEYFSDPPPDDIRIQVDMALAESKLSEELQEALLALEADDGEEPPATKKKAAAKDSEKEPKKKRGRKQAAATAQPAPQPKDAAPADPAAEPGPAEMEPDEKAPTPPRPPAEVSPARDEEDDPEPVPDEGPEAVEPAPAAEDLAASGAAIVGAVEAGPVGSVDEDWRSELEGEHGVESAGNSETYEAEDGDEAQEAAADGAGGQETPEETAEAGAEVSFAGEEPYPGAFDADQEDEDEPYDTDDGTTAVAAEETGQAAAPDDDLTVYSKGQEEPVLAVEEQPPAAQEPEPPAAAPAEVVNAEPPAPAQSKKTNGAATAQSGNGASSSQPPKPPESPELNEGNNFGLSPAIAKKYGEAVVQFLAKDPLLASTAVASVSAKLGAILTTGMKNALLPMLNHLAANGKIQRRAAGSDLIFFVDSQAKTVDAWYAKHTRANA